MIYCHYMPERTHAGLPDESKVLCGLSTEPPVNVRLNGAETYGHLYTKVLADVTCRDCKAEYKRLHPEAYAAMEAQKALDEAPPARRKGRTDPGHDYSRNDKKGWGGDPRRGAALGRYKNDVMDPASWEGKLYVSEIRLDVGGYDSNGTYFGAGPPAVFWIRSADYEIDTTARFANRMLAIGELAKKYPKATFARGLSKKTMKWLEENLGHGGAT